MIAADSRAALGLRLQIEMLGSGLIRLRAEISNTGSAPYQVNAVTLRLPVPRAEELLDSAGHWGAERSPQRMPFSVGCHLREGRAGRTGADAAYLMHAGVSGFSFQQGQVWAVHTAWSGNHTTVAERTSYGRWLGGGELLLPGEVVLAEQQSYRSPWLYGSYGVGLDAVAHRFHRYLRSRPQHPSPQRPVTLNSWEAMYFDLSTEALIELVDAGAAVGVERFVIDDGWFGSRRDDYRGLGDWWVSPEVFPEGLHAVARRCAEHGIQLGLWVEPEMVNLDSDLARAHPDWVLQVPGRMPPEQRHQQVLDLTVPEAYRQLRDRLLALLDEYPIGYLKWDHNRDLVEPGSVLAGGAAAVHEQTLAAYRLMAELKAHRPGLEIGGSTCRCWRSPTGSGPRTVPTRPNGCGSSVGRTGCCRRNWLVAIFRPRRTIRPCGFTRWLSGPRLPCSVTSGWSGTCAGSVTRTASSCAGGSSATGSCGD